VQGELSTSMANARKSLRDLANDRKKAVMDSQSQSKVEMQGIEALKKYDLLLTIRYADPQGLYQPAAEVSQKDNENLNKLFDTYLRASPLTGRSSVAHARKMIEWGMHRLEELAKIHGDPNENNNPDLEIIAQQTKDADQRIKTVTELASRLGVKLNENVASAQSETPAVAATPGDAGRRPASQGKKQNMVH
jgi:hypothetical protein